jgi:hypothetical protein
MTGTIDPAVRRQLELDIAAIGRDFVPARPPVVYGATVAKPVAKPAAEPVVEEKAAARESFCRWLLVQRDRGDWIDALAAAARVDRGFPREGDVGAVHARLIVNGADPDMFEQLDDAERCWRSL